MTGSQLSRACVGAVIGIVVVVLFVTLKGWAFLALAAGAIGWVLGWLWR